MKKKLEYFKEKAGKSMTPKGVFTKSRRDFLKGAGRLFSLSLMGVGLGYLTKPRKEGTLWQLDASKCVQCGKCATECVLSPSAVKCVHAFDICGYCKLCGGYHKPNARKLNTAAENQLCPISAIKRTFIEDPFYEYTIDETLCIGCGKCVKGCGSFGNGSLYLQVRHTLCVGCNDCSIARNCPARAYIRVPQKKPYWIKRREENS